MFARIRLEHAGADVQRVLGIEHAHFGALRGLAVLDGVHLVEVGNERGARPHFLAEHAIDIDVGVEVLDLEDLAAGNAVGVVLLRHRRRTEQCE